MWVRPEPTLVMYLSDAPVQSWPYPLKHSSLLIKLLNYRRKKFYNIGPWCDFHLHIFIVTYEWVQYARAFVPNQAFEPQCYVTL
jgi:hypothetical protein